MFLRKVEISQPFVFLLPLCLLSAILYCIRLLYENKLKGEILMQTKTTHRNKLISTFLTLALLITSLLGGLPPLTASADGLPGGGGGSGSYSDADVINLNDFVLLEDEYVWLGGVNGGVGSSWRYEVDDASGTIYHDFEILDDVTIIGEAHFPEDHILSLLMPSNSTVIWDAELYGNIYNNSVLSVFQGEFIMEGGVIANMASSGIAIYATNASIVLTEDSAVFVFNDDLNDVVKLAGGDVPVIEDNAVIIAFDDIDVWGDLVEGEADDFGGEGSVLHIEKAADNDFDYEYDAFLYELWIFYREGSGDVSVFYYDFTPIVGGDDVGVIDLSDFEWDDDDFVWTGGSSGDGWEYDIYAPSEFTNLHEFYLTGDVIITGEASLPEFNNISLFFDKYAKVTWEAELYGYNKDGSMLSIIGDGEFLMTDGRIINTAPNGVAVSAYFQDCDVDFFIEKGVLFGFNYICDIVYGREDFSVGMNPTYCQILGDEALVFSFDSYGNFDWRINENNWYNDDFDVYSFIDGGWLEIDYTFNGDFWYILDVELPEGYGDTGGGCGGIGECCSEPNPNCTCGCVDCCDVGVCDNCNGEGCDVCVDDCECSGVGCDMCDGSEFYPCNCGTDEVKELFIENEEDFRYFYEELLEDNTAWCCTTIYLEADLDLTGKAITEPAILTNAVFDGQGYTISGLNVTGTGQYILNSGGGMIEQQSYDSDYGNLYHAAGLFAVLEYSTVRNLVLDNPVIISDKVENGTDKATALGAVTGLGVGAQIRDVEIINPTVMLDVEEFYRNSSAFIGGVAGYLHKGEYKNSVGLYMSIMNGVDVYGGEVAFVTMFAPEIEISSMLYMGGAAGASYDSNIASTAIYGTLISAGINDSLLYGDCWYCDEPYTLLCKDCQDCVDCHNSEGFTICLDCGNCNEIGDGCGYCELLIGDCRNCDETDTLLCWWNMEDCIGCEDCHNYYNYTICPDCGFCYDRNDGKCGDCASFAAASLFVGGIVGYTSAVEPASLACVLNTLSMAELDIKISAVYEEFIGGIAGQVYFDSAVNNLYIGEEKAFGEVFNGCNSCGSENPGEVALFRCCELWWCLYCFFGAGLSLCGYCQVCSDCYGDEDGKCKIDNCGEDMIGGACGDCYENDLGYCDECDFCMTCGVYFDYNQCGDCLRCLCHDVHDDCDVGDNYSNPYDVYNNLVYATAVAALADDVIAKTSDTTEGTGGLWRAVQVTSAHTTWSFEHSLSRYRQWDEKFNDYFDGITPMLGAWYECECELCVIDDPDDPVCEDCGEEPCECPKPPCDCGICDDCDPKTFTPCGTNCKGEGNCENPCPTGNTKKPSGGGGGGGTPSDETPATPPVQQVSGTTTIIVNIPKDVINAINDNIPVNQLKVTTAGNVSVSVGADFAGQNAVLVKFNAETGELEFVSASTVGTNGNANINVAAAGDYLVLTFKTGDITGTGEVETSDALALLRHIAGISELNSIQQFVANGGKGDIGTNNALNILRLVAGIIEKI